MSFLTRLFPQPVRLGRWARKTAALQLKADVHDPGYDQMHWSVSPGKARQAAIDQHYKRLDGRRKTKK